MNRPALSYCANCGKHHRMSNSETCSAICASLLVTRRAGDRKPASQETGFKSPQGEIVQFPRHHSRGPVLPKTDEDGGKARGIWRRIADWASKWRR